MLEIKKGALGALVVVHGAGNCHPESPAMDVTNHGALDSDRDGGETCSVRYEVP